MMISPTIIMITIICTSIVMLRCTKDREVNNLIRGLEVWLFQVLLFIGLYLLGKDYLESQTIRLILISSAIITLSSGIILARRSCKE